MKDNKVNGFNNICVVYDQFSFSFLVFSDSPVYQSSDGHKWLLAKQIFQVADFAHAEMIEHLLKTHLVLEPICVVAKRALSEFHPLSHLLRWHCRGLFVTNSYGLPRLVLPNGYMHKLFAIGNVGAIELLNKGYADMSWEDVDFLKNIKVKHRDDTLNYITLHYVIRSFTLRSFTLCY